MSLGSSPDTRPFHRGLAGYEITPLVSAAALAAELGLDRLYVKDESRRFALPAFKFLGVSWAVSQLLGGGTDVGELARRAREQGIDRLTTATDGNHGRAVARMAALLGVRATIYIPRAMRPARRDAIASEGAELVVVAAGYDAAVRRSLADAAGDPACRALNDADLDGSSPVAAWVIEGYSTLFREIDEQLPADAEIDLVLLQTGVGAFAAAGVRWALGRGVLRRSRSTPPVRACIAASLAAGTPLTIATSRTSMAGPGSRDALGGGLADALPRGSRARSSWTMGGRPAPRAISPALESRPASRARQGSRGCARSSRTSACSPLRPGRLRQAVLVVTEGATDPERYRHGSWSASDRQRAAAASTDVLRARSAASSASVGGSPCARSGATRNRQPVAALASVDAAARVQARQRQLAGVGVGLEHAEVGDDDGDAGAGQPETLARARSVAVADGRAEVELLDEGARGLAQHHERLVARRRRSRVRRPRRAGAPSGGRSRRPRWC